jgi:hypothetical protein
MDIVCAPIFRALLRPFSFIVLAADFLPKDGIEHIRQSKEKTSQMGEVSNSASGSSKRREEFDEAEKDDKVFCGDGEQEIDIDGPMGEEPPEGQKESVDRSRSPDYRDELFGRENHGADPCPDSTKEKISQKFR